MTEKKQNTATQNKQNKTKAKSNQKLQQQK